MPEKRLQRTRAAYACPSCDGTGRVDDWEGAYECSTCHGSGIVLDKQKPTPPTSGRTFIVSDSITQEGVSILADSIRSASLIRKEY